MVETLDTIKFFVKLGYKPTELKCLVCYKDMGDALEMKHNNV